jgi:hypothetical protein
VYPQLCPVPHTVFPQLCPINTLQPHACPIHTVNPPCPITPLTHTIHTPVTTPATTPVGGGGFGF